MLLALNNWALHIIYENGLYCLAVFGIYYVFIIFTYSFSKTAYKLIGIEIYLKYWCFSSTFISEKERKISCFSNLFFFFFTVV